MRGIWKRPEHFQSMGQLWKTNGAVAHIHCKLCVEGTSQSVIPGRCVSGDFAHLLEIMEPPYCSRTLSSLPAPSFLFSTAVPLFSFTVCLWIFIQKTASGTLPRFSFHHLTHHAHLPCLTFFFWRIISSWYCVGFCCTMKWISHMYTYIPSLLIHSSSHPSRSSQSPELTALHYTAALH